MTDVDAGLKRVLGPVSSTSIVIGAIIGVGIFFTPSQIAATTGSPGLAMWTWALGGLMALLGALVFAELGGMYGRTGGQYEIMRDAYGVPVAFCFVFCNSSAILAGAAAIISIICAQNLGVLFTGEPPGATTVTIMSAALIAGLVCANVGGVKWGATIQNVTVFAKLATLLLVAVLAVAMTPDAVKEVPTLKAESVADGPWISLLLAGLVPALFSFGGWQHALWIGGEVKNPKRNVPLAIVVGVLVVVVVYMLANWAYFSLLGYGGVVDSETLAADAVSKVWPDTGRRLVAGAVAFSAFGVLNAQLLSGPRLLCGMARDGKFFRAFGKVHGRLGTPVPAIVLVGSIGLGLVVIAGEAGVGGLLTGVVLVDAVFFCLTGMALLVLRRVKKHAERPVRVPLYPLVPVAFVLLEMAVIFGAFQIEKNRDAAWIGLAWIAVAALCYVVFFRGPKNTGSRGS
ncbi:MAG: amino acid permease [Planctomycetes bacterium]|nr:amino acid permease [Planctomycetota bacterium]